MYGGTWLATRVVILICYPWIQANKMIVLGRWPNPALQGTRPLLRFRKNVKVPGWGCAPERESFSLRFAQGERGAEWLVPALRAATGEPGTRDGSPFEGPLSAALDASKVTAWTKLRST